MLQALFWVLLLRAPPCFPGFISTGSTKCRAYAHNVNSATTVEVSRIKGIIDFSKVVKTTTTTKMFEGSSTKELCQAQRKEVVISENNLCKIRGVRWQVGETEKKC